MKRKIDMVLIAILVGSAIWLAATGRLGQGPTGIMLLGFLLTFYIFPALVAFGRKHRQRTAIAVLNVLLGWTFIGWVAALVWACTSDVEPRTTDIKRDDAVERVLRSASDPDS